MNTNQINTNAKEHYTSLFQSFEKSLNGKRELSSHSLRQEAITKFSELEFPTKKDEEWKYTNISPIIEKKFDLAKKPETNISSEIVNNHLLHENTENVLVFLNGYFCNDLSSLSLPQKVVVKNLANALVEDKDLVEKHLKYNDKDEIFSTLNTAFFREGVFVYIPANTIMESPIHVLHLSGSEGENSVSHFRNIIIVEEHSEVTLIENYQSLQSSAYFNNIVTDVFVAKSANVQQIRLQEENENSYQINRHNVYQQEASIYTQTTVDLGGHIVRNNINVSLEGAHCESNLYGFYMGNNSQLIDNHTFIDHAKPNCNSNELYKGILCGKSKGVFNGKVLVRQEAQKTNAYQQNQNIILNDEASVDTKPQLEIFADDVRCSHGATIGALDEGALFYLRARGVGEEQAHFLLRQAFAAQSLQKIRQETIREKIQEIIVSRF